jgi:hypothetical protein
MYLYMRVSVCMCMYLIFCFAQDAEGKTLPRPGPGALQCAVKKGITGQQKYSDNSGTRTPVYKVICVGISHWANCGWHKFNFVVICILVTNTYSYRQYIHIHTYTYTYQQYMHNTDTYMHAPITVGRVFWGAVADAVGLRERYNFPIGCDGAWDRVDKRGSGLGPHPTARGGGSGTSNRGGGGGVCAKSGCRREQGWSKNVFAPWVRPAGRRLRRRSLGGMAVIIVSATAIQANTTLIHTI